MTIEPYDASVFQKINFKNFGDVNDEESLYSKPSDYFLCCEIVELVFYSQFVQCILLIKRAQTQRRTINEGENIST